MTKRQRECLYWLVRHEREYGCTASFDFLCEKMEYKSKSNVVRITNALARDGYINKPKYRNRAIIITKEGYDYIERTKAVDSEVA